MGTGVVNTSLVAPRKAAVRIVEVPVPAEQPPPRVHDWGGARHAIVAEAGLLPCPVPGTAGQRGARQRPRCRSLLGVSVRGTGSYVPDPVVTNADLQQRLGFDPDWIVQRTGIRQRRQAPAHQATSDLCAAAARRCIAQAGVDPQDIDLLLLATFTPDMAFPATACLVQERLGLCRN